jgi:amidohydrolase
MGVKDVAKNYEEYVIAMRRKFHAHPEISMKEYETSRIIKEELDKIGVSWVDCGGETGVLATIRGGKPGKTILLRADMDGLSVTEETGLPFASENEGVMHACGHDAHTSALLTAAHILNDMKDELCGTVRLAFEPGEEVALGAKGMVAAGALDGVDACFGMHVWPDLPAGKVSIDAGARMASSDRFTIDVTGQGGHGAAPHQCVDASMVTAAIAMNLQELVNREINPQNMAVCSVGIIQAGSRWSAIAEYGHIEGTTRCYDPDVYEKWPERIDRIAKGTAEMYRAKAVSKMDRLAPPVINDPAVSAVCRGSAASLFGEDAVVSVEASTVSEDFPFFLEKVPGAFAFFGVGQESAGENHPLHNCRFAVDEKVLINMAMLHAQIAMDFNRQ